jgi:hypothetical protein
MKVVTMMILCKSLAFFIGLGAVEDIHTVQGEPDPGGTGYSK